LSVAARLCRMKKGRGGREESDSQTGTSAGKKVANIRAPVGGSARNEPRGKDWEKRKITEKVESSCEESTRHG